MHPYPKHLDGLAYRGFRRYFLTFCTHERRPHFATHSHVEFVQQYFLNTATECGFADLAHCFMPDHLHAALEGRQHDADAKRFIARMKQMSGHHFQKQFGSRLWQRYGYEHVIRSDESTQVVVRYILANPIRAGLATVIGEYPYIGSSEFSREQLIAFCSATSG